MQVYVRWCLHSSARDSVSWTRLSGSLLTHILCFGILDITIWLNLYSIPLINTLILFIIQLGQLRLNPTGLGSKCGKWVERFSDFGKYKGNVRNHTTSLPTYRTLSKWGKWVDRLSDFGKYKGYIRNHSTSLPAYHTLSQVRGGSTSADLAVWILQKEWKYLFHCSTLLLQE